MANFLGGSSGRTNNPPVAATTLRIQNAVQGQPLAILHGQNRIAANIIDYWGFTATAQSSGGGGGKGGMLGGGGKGSSVTGYTYNVSVIFGLCEGPIDQVILGWNGKSPFRLDVDLGEGGSGNYYFIPVDGAQAQAPWSYALSTNANHALGYSSLAYIGGENIYLGNSPELPNYNWEVRGAISGALTETYTVVSPYTYTAGYFSLASSVTELVVVPPAAPYQVQAANPTAANALPVVLETLIGFWDSLAGIDALPGSASAGVVYQTTGLPLTRVVGTPSAGQYNVGSSGLYAFSAADAGAGIQIIDLAVGPGVNYAYQPTGNTVSGSTSVGALSSMAGIAAGQLVTGAGIAPGTVVQALDAGSVTLSQPATATATGVMLTFYGAALSQVLGTPGQGQFSLSVAAGAYGQYLFSAADAGATLVITDVPDADPSLSLVDFLSNPRYGCGFPAQYIGDLSGLRNYAYANGLFISPAITGSQAANGYLGDFSTGLNGEFVWSSGLLTFVPYGDTAISGNGKSWSPPPSQYSLGDDDFLPNEGTASVGVSAFTSDDPVVCVRKRQSDALNDVKVEYLDRGNSYNPSIVEAQDDAAINQFGLRPADTKALHFFCIEAAALTSAQLQLGRQQIRNQYSFTVPWYFILLDPMDVIEITDAALGLDAATVRILEITENQQDWSLTITAEDYLVGTGTTPVYGSQPKAGYVPNYNAAPGDLVNPVIFEPPVQIATTGGLEMWLLCGGDGSVGGYDLYVSLDGNTYQNVGRQMGGNRVGYTTSALPLGSNPDTVDTLGVDLSATQGSLSPGTAQDAENAVTLCYLGGYPLPAAPSLSAVAGGARPAASYFVRVTYVFPGGEGPASAEDDIILAAGQLLAVASPSAVSGATGWNVYVGLSTGAEELQNSSPIAIGTGWTEPSGGLVSGNAPPSAEAGYELISYEGAALTSQYRYTLGTYLGRGLYGSEISAHGVGTQFARLDGTQFVYAYDKSYIGQTIYIKLTPFNPWGGGEPDLASVQPYLHVIQGPPAPGLVQGFTAVQTGDVVLLTWSPLDTSEISGYDIAYGPVGGSVADAFASSMITEASRATAETTVAIPVGTWNLFIRGHGLVSDQTGPVSQVSLTVTNENTPVLAAEYGPDWLGTLTGFVRHYTGVLMPDQTSLASALTFSQLFETFCHAPVATATYDSAPTDTGFNDGLHVYISSTQSTGPGVSGSPSVSYGLDTWLTGGSDPGSFSPWTLGNVTARYLRAQINETPGASPSIVSQLSLTASVPSAVTDTVQGFSISNSAGTVLTFASEGAGPFHSPPTVVASPTDGVLQGVGVSAISTTQCTLQGFVSGAPSTGTCNVAITGE